MRLAYSSIFKVSSQSSLVFVSGITLAATVFNIIPCYAQLPPTNMGQFIHQPGDNQYTNQTQSERHISAAQPTMPAAMSSAPASTPDYVPTPAAPKADVSLLPIVADEPIKPAGFPPLPDRLDLPTTGLAIWSNNTTASAGGIAGGGTNVSDNGISHDAQGIHQHYVHYQAGAFMPNQPAQQNPYKPSSSDYYNINPNARPGMTSGATAANPPLETPSMQALKRMGAEPQLAADRVTKPEAPEAVTVNQSVSQDLSLPEDDFNQHYPTAINNTATGRASRGMGRSLMYPARMLLYSGAGMAMYAARR
jgi:hypothetical protein